MRCVINAALICSTHNYLVMINSSCSMYSLPKEYHGRNQPRSTSECTWTTYYSIREYISIYIHTCTYIEANWVQTFSTCQTVLINLIFSYRIWNAVCPHMPSNNNMGDAKALIYFANMVTYKLPNKCAILVIPFPNFSEPPCRCPERTGSHNRFSSFESVRARKFLNFEIACAQWVLL